MNNSAYLERASVLSLVALAVLAVSALSGILASPGTGQEVFEYIYPFEQYVQNLNDAEPALRTVLFFDSIFALVYTAAICFAVIGFRARSLPLAWFCGLGILGVMGLDYWENIIMVHSLDLADLGEMSPDRMVFLAGVSAVKWHLSAAVLFAISFLLPDRRLSERLLVWGTRLGLMVAVPLFVVNGFGLRQAGMLLILISMAGGFILLSIVARQNSRETV